MNHPTKTAPKIRKILNIAIRLPLCLAITLSACSPGTVGQAERAANAQAIDAAHLVDQSQAPMDEAATGRVSVDDDAYLPADSRISLHGIDLPPALSNISIDETDAESLPEIARTLSMRLGIPVTLAPDAAAAVADDTTASATPVSSGAVTQTISNLGLSGGSADMTNVSNGEITPPTETADTMVLHWHGPYSGLLDQIAAKFGLTYTYNGSFILISKNITRTYTVHALASDLSLTQNLEGSGINSTSGSGGSTNGATSNVAQTVNSTETLSVWNDITNGVKSIVGPNGEIATILSTGTVTVTAPPPIVQDVQDFIDQENRSLENEITVTVQVLTVQLSNSDNNTFDLSAALGTIGRSVTLGNQTPGSTGTTGATGTGTITPGLSIVSGGSTATIEAISQFGRVASRTQSAVTTMNGFIAPFQLTNTRNYVSSASTTITPSGSGTTTTESLTPSTVTTGYNIAVLPRVDFTDGTVLLQYGISISSLAGAVNGFDIFTTPDGTSSVQLANVNQQAFIDNAEVPDGDTIVITGYNQNQDTANKTGFGTAGFFGLSGNQTGDHSQDETVILITPTVLHVAHNQIETELN